MERLITVFESILSRMVPTRGCVIPRFRGLSHENPLHFMDRAQNAVLEANIPRDQRVERIAENLSGDALHWYQTKASYITDFLDFREAFLENFNHPLLIMAK